MLKYFLVYCCDLLGGSELFSEVVPGRGELPDLTGALPTLLPLATLAEANSGYRLGYVPASGSS